MNTWQIHVAARKRVKARRDIFSLLKNSHPRRPKNKKKYSITRKRFGIFANAISFKISRDDANKVRSDLPSPSQSSTNAALIERIKPAKRSKDLSAKNQGFGVTDMPKENHDVTNIHHFNNNQAQQVQYPRESIGQSATVSPKQTTCLNVLSDKHNHRTSVSNHASSYHPKTTHHNHSAFDEGQFSSKFDTFADIPFNNLPESTGIEHQILTFDSLIDANSPIVPKKLISSADFNQFEIGDDCSSFSQILGSSSNDNSIISGFCSDGDSIFGIEVETTNMLSDKESFETESSSNLSVNDQSLTTPSNNHLKLSPNQSLFEFSNGLQSVSNGGSSVFRPQIKNSMNMTNVDEKRPKLTVNMIIARKRLAARQSYQLLFATTDRHLKLIV